MKHTCEKCGHTAAAEQFGDECPHCEEQIPCAHIGIDLSKAKDKTSVHMICAICSTIFNDINHKGLCEECHEKAMKPEVAYP